MRTRTAGQKEEKKKKKIWRNMNLDSNNASTALILGMRSDLRSSWMVIGDFCCSVSGLTHFSHLLWAPKAHRLCAFIHSFEWISVLVTHQWAFRESDQTLHAEQSRCHTLWIIWFLSNLLDLRSRKTASIYAAFFMSFAWLLCDCMRMLFAAIKNKKH